MYYYGSIRKVVQAFLIVTIAVMISEIIEEETFSYMEKRFSNECMKKRRKTSPTLYMRNETKLVEILPLHCIYFNEGGMRKKNKY